MNTTNRKIASSAMAFGLLTNSLPTLSLAEEKNSISSNMPTQLMQTQQPNLKVLKDDTNEKIVEASDNHIVSTSTYDKKNKILHIATKNVADHTISTKTVHLQHANSLLHTRKKRESWDIEVLDHASSLDGKFEYTYYNKNVWLLRVPGENAKNPVENSENKADLNGFRNAVNNLMTHEIAFLSKVSGDVAIACIALLSTPTPWTVVSGAAATIGLAAWAVPDLYKVFQEADNCRYHFNRI